MAEILTNIIVAVVAQVIADRLCKWLNDHTEDRLCKWLNDHTEGR